MEGRESMGLPPSGIMAGPPGLHAPSPMRPATNTTTNNNNNNNNSNPSPLNLSAAAGPHGINLNANRGMGVGLGIDPVKRKRGRPRKYGPDGSMALALAPLSAAPGPFSPSQKRGRGRPPGSGKKQRLAALGEWLASSAGMGFTPHVITIATGEDVASKIMSFSQQGPRAICILSANGAISNVTLRQSATSGGTLTYEGRFEILSLSGSFLLTENGGTRSRTGGLSVSLAGPDGRVVGGGVAGMLMAASPVQVVVGSFVTNGQKEQARLSNAEPCIGLSQAAVSGSPVVAIPISRAAINETYGSPSSLPLNQNTGATAGNHGAPQSTQNMSSFQSMGWSGSQSIGEARHNTDINIPLPGG